MDNENPHNPEAAIQQLIALENVPANFRPTVLKRVTAFVKGHLEALIKSQAQLARDRLALKADRQKLVEDTSTSQAITMELEKDNQLLKSENQSLIDKYDDLTQEQRKLESKLSGSKYHERRLRKERDELKEESKRINDRLLVTLEAHKKVQQKLLDQDKSKKDAINQQIQGIGAQVSQMLTMTTERVNNLESRLQEAIDDGIVLQLEAEMSKNRLRDYRQEEAECKSQVEALETYARNLEGQLKRARSAGAKTAEEPKKMPGAREKDAARVTQLQKDIEVANGTAHSHKTEADRLKSELETTKASLQEAQRTSQATQIKLDEEQNKLQKANEQLEEIQSKLGEEQRKLREATADLDQKRARLLELEQSGHANPLKRRRSRSPQRDLPARTDWGHAPEWLMRNLNLIQPCQDARSDFPSTENVFCEIASLLITERSHRTLKEFLEYAELDEVYCFNTALDCDTGQKAASIKHEACHVHEDSEDDYCLPVYFWLRNGKKLMTFYQANV